MPSKYVLCFSPKLLGPEGRVSHCLGLLGAKPGSGAALLGKAAALWWVLCALLPGPMLSPVGVHHGPHQACCQVAHDLGCRLKDLPRLVPFLTVLNVHICPRVRLCCRSSPQRHCVLGTLCGRLLLQRAS